MDQAIFPERRKNEPLFLYLAKGFGRLSYLIERNAYAESVVLKRYLDSLAEDQVYSEVMKEALDLFKFEVPNEDLLINYATLIDLIDKNDFKSAESLKKIISERKNELKTH